MLYLWSTVARVYGRTCRHRTLVTKVFLEIKEENHQKAPEAELPLPRPALSCLTTQIQAWGEQSTPTFLNP